MEPFRRVTGVVAPLDRPDVDTDQIIPKQFLKRVERTGYGPFLFHDWRYGDDGSEDPGFVLNRDPYREARILVTGPNFGCGSSREHAAWALGDFGIRAVIAPSFADIFRSNCFQNGLLPVEVAEELVAELVERAQSEPGWRATVDLEAEEIREAADGGGPELRERGDSGAEEREEPAAPEALASFEVDPFRRRCLLKGWDDVALTLRREEKIRAYEEAAQPPASSPGRRV